jgi:hypothetical protein
MLKYLKTEEVIFGTKSVFCDVTGKGDAEYRHFDPFEHNIPSLAL